MSKNDFKNLDWKAPSREWDIRVNLGEDWQKELDHFVSVCKKYTETVNVRFLLVGAAEIGGNKDHGSYEKAHCHAALVTVDRVRPLAIRDKLELGRLSDGTPRNYYLSMRNFNFPYSGWVDHHTKEETKILKASTLHLESFAEIEAEERKTYTAFTYGQCPQDKRKAESQEVMSKADFRRQKIDERFQEMLEIYVSGDFNNLEMLKRYGIAWANNQKKFASLLGSLDCCDPPAGKFPDGKTLVIWGPPGTGKSLYVKYKFPKAFFRSPLEMKFWGGFNPSEHTHIYYEDLDRAQFSKFGVGQWKVWLDPNGGYDGEMKFERPLKNIRHPVVVTSNYHPSDWLLPGWGLEVDKEAILRRLRIVHINELLREEGIRLKPVIPPNSKPEECFEEWDWDAPSQYASGFITN